MKATAILRDFSDSFWTGEIRYSNGELSSFRGTGWNFLSDAERWAHCLAESTGNNPRIPVKIGNGSFRDRFDLNHLCRQPHSIQCVVSPRRGYKLATFTFSRI